MCSSCLLSTLLLFQLIVVGTDTGEGVVDTPDSADIAMISSNDELSVPFEGTSLTPSSNLPPSTSVNVSISESHQALLDSSLSDMMVPFIVVSSLL